MINFFFPKDKFLKPNYRISPFRTSLLGANQEIFNLGEVDNNSIISTFGDNFLFTINGKSAIELALIHLGLSKSDTIAILTTSGSYYISNCVTSIVEKYTHWGRNITSKTKMIFVIHEFGFPYRDLVNLREYGIPIIEDCAHSFFSQNSNNDIGNVGDFVIYSLPKIFPINFGGVIKSNIGFIKGKVGLSYDYDSWERKYLHSLTSHYLNQKDYIIEKRKKNFIYLFNKFGNQYSLRFTLNDLICPGALLIDTPLNIDLQSIKSKMQENGVECTILYKNNTFILPIHQNMTEFDCDYVYELFNQSLLSLEV